MTSRVGDCSSGSARSQKEGDASSRAAGEAQPSAAFTAGPWAYRPDPSDDWGWVRDARGCVVAMARNPDAGELAAYRASKTDPYEANARLIAAAPDLLSSLRVMTALVRLKYGNLDPDVNRALDAAYAALAKATPAPQSGVTATGREADPGSTQ